MALDTGIASYEAPEKDLYELGEIPPMGYVPKQMYAWAIRKERHGEPNTAMLQEVVDVPKLDSHDVLVLVMAAGVASLYLALHGDLCEWPTRTSA